MRRRVVPLAFALLAATATPVVVGGPAPAEPPSRFDALMRARATARTAVVGDVAVCFAPGTPDDVIAAVTAVTADAKAFQAQDSRRWSTTATDTFKPLQGSPITLTWSVVPNGTPINGALGATGGPSDLRTFLDGIYGSETQWLPILERAFERWGEQCGITYVYEPDDDGVRLGSAPGRLGVRGDVRIGGKPVDGPFGVLAYNAYPNDGDMVIDTDDAYYGGVSQNSRRLRNVIAHEHGHGIGLDHVCPLTRTKLMEPAASTSYDGPQQDDVLAAQRLYGDRFEPNDSTGGAEPLVPKNRKLVATNVSIDDDSDQDYYAFDAAEGTFADIVLHPLGSKYSSGPEADTGLCKNEHPKIDTREFVDLRLALLAPDGAVVASVNATGRGETEELIDIPLPAGAGRYFVRVRGSGENEPQRYDLSVKLAQRGEKPVAHDDAVRTFEVLPVEVPVLDNDAGLGDAPIRVRLDAPPASGLAKLVGDRFVYVPARDFVGDDRITYEVSDLHGQVARADVVVSVDASARAGAARVDGDGDGYPDELEARLLTDAGDPGSRPGEEIAGGGLPLDLAKVTLTVEPRKESRDAIALRGVLPIAEGFEPEGRSVVVSVGGVVTQVVLDAKGRAVVDGRTLLRLRIKRKKRVVVAGPTRFDLAHKRGDFAEDLVDEGLGTGRKQKKEPRAVTVFVLFEGRTYEATVPLVYSAKAGKKGKAKRVK